MRTARSRMVLLMMALAMFALSVSAQGGKKPKPLATPPVDTGAQIISQAGDYPEPSPSPAEKAPSSTSTSPSRYSELNERVKRLEAGQNDDYDQRQKRLLMN